MDNLEMLKELCFVGIGFIIGRVTMAIQYELMKPRKKEENKYQENRTQKDK